ncbi:MAG: type I 3-dehydroquinate dehydratase, partial [Nitrososphaerales archaeon]
MPSTEQKVLSGRLHAPSSSKFCVSVYGHSIADLKGRIASAREFSPTFIELRLDYLLNPDPVAIAKLSGALEGNEIFTFRSRAEGGVSKLSEDSWIKILSRMI